MYNSLSELHENLDKQVLPKEYGGEMPMAEMISNYLFSYLYNLYITNTYNIILLSVHLIQIFTYSEFQFIF